MEVVEAAAEVAGGVVEVAEDLAQEVVVEAEEEVLEVAAVVEDLEVVVEGHLEEAGAVGGGDVMSSDWPIRPKDLLLLLSVVLFLLICSKLLSTPTAVHWLNTT